jgi:hypothetical protein
MFRSYWQASYCWAIIIANVFIQLHRSHHDIVLWLLLLNLSLAAIFPHFYEKWLGSRFLTNHGIGQNAGLHELVRALALFLLTFPLLVFLFRFFQT